MNPTDILSGEQFQQLCEVYCGTEYDLNRNPKISAQGDKHFYIERLTSEWDNPSLIFCYSCALNIFIEKLEFFKNPFTLVSHNEDNNITEKYYKLLESPLLVHWYAQNLMISHPKVEFIPIGIANAMWPHGNVNTLLTISELSKNIPKTNDIYFYFSLHTNRPARESCKLELEGKGLRFGSNLQHSEYLKELASYKFAICPEGNGIDCHRTWECYYLGVIPILLKNNFSINLQKHLPCILLDSWNDFDASCISQYNELFNQLNTVQKYLTLSYYKEKILSSISLAYVFIGPLPSYCIDTVYQSRLFHNGPIYFIVSDYDSPYIKKLEEYKVTIIRYDSVIHEEFNKVVQNVYHKFCIATKLVGREKIFIYSFERFFVLYNLMKMYDIKNVFFMELDNLIYDVPSKWLNSLSKNDLAFMFDNHDRYASGVFYVKSADSFNNFCDYALDFISTSNEFMAEMIFLSKFYEYNKESIQLLPIHWSDSKYPKECHETFELYNSVFDSAAIGVFLGGADPYHVEVTGVYKQIEGNKSFWSLIDYTGYSYKWEVDFNGRKIPFVYNGSEWLRINNLHIHSKNLKPCLSKEII